jgi:type I restriction enzyme S subunit
MKHEILTGTERRITEEAVAECATNVIPRGNVVIATRVGLGKVCILDQDTAINQDLRGILPRRMGQVDVRFLFRWFQSIAGQIESAGTGMTVKGVTLPYVKGLRFPLPTLGEQQRIVTTLDAVLAGIDVAVANAEKNVANARELFQHKLCSIFAHTSSTTWVDTRLGDVASIQSGGTPLRSAAEYWGGDIPWYSSGELNTVFTMDPERCITQAGLAGSNAKLFPSGSLLVGMYDTAALKMSLLDRPAAFNQAIAGIRPNDNLDLRFVRYAINAMKTELLSRRRGVRQKNLSLEKIKDIVISVPGLPEQMEVVRQLIALEGDVQRLTGVIERKLVALTELKQSILQKAFAGELAAEKAEREMAGV